MTSALVKTALANPNTTHGGKNYALHAMVSNHALWLSQGQSSLSWRKQSVHLEFVPLPDGTQGKPFTSSCNRISNTSLVRILCHAIDVLLGDFPRHLVHQICTSISRRDAGCEGGADYIVSPAPDFSNLSNLVKGRDPWALTRWFQTSSDVLLVEIDVSLTILGKSPCIYGTKIEPFVPFDIEWHVTHVCGLILILILGISALM